MLKSDWATRIKCETPLCVWPLWLLAVPPGKLPVNGLTQLREPRPVWFELLPTLYGSEQPTPKCVPFEAELQVPQTFCCSAVKACFNQD